MLHISTGRLYLGAGNFSNLVSFGLLLLLLRRLLLLLLVLLLLCF